MSALIPKVEQNNQQILNELDDIFADYNFKNNEYLVDHKTEITVPNRYRAFMDQEIVKCAIDPIYFAENYFYIISLKSGKIKISPYSKQRELILDCFRQNRLVTLASRQSGKALTLDTPILTPNGFKLMGDLNVGDIIYGPDGKKTNIKFITETMYDHKLYEVIFENGEIIKCDADHLWLVNYTNSNKHKSDMILTTSDMKNIQNRISKWNKPSRLYIKMSQAIEFEPQQVPIDPYVLGLWLGDGSRCDGRITSHINDYHFYKSILEQKNYTISNFRPDKRRPNTGGFNIEGLIKKLKNINLKNNKHIPDIYYFNSVEVRLELIRGLMDSDGYCHTRGGCVFYQSNYAMIRDVQKILISLGIKTSISEKKTYRKTCYGISFNSSQYSYFKLPRKLERQKTSKHHPKNTKIYIREINEIKSEPVRCLQVDNKEHLFLCGNSLIPTHNTTAYSIFATHYICFQENKKILIVANKLDTAIEIIDRIKFAFELLPKWLKPKVKSWNKKSIKLHNGCVIECTATSSNAARSKSSNCLIIDECAHIDEKLMLNFWNSVYPILSSDPKSKCIMVSTPLGTGNLYYRTYQQALSNQKDASNYGWKHFRIDWWDVPGRDEEWKKQQLASMNYDEKAFAQEFGNDFLGSAYTLVNADRIYKKKTRLQEEKLIEKGIKYEFLNGYEAQIWELPQKDRCYVLGLDTADGTGNDASVINIYDITNPSKEINLVAKFDNNTIEPVKTAYIVAKMGLMYNYCPVCIERNGPGATVINFLHKVYEYENIVNAGSTKLQGIYSNHTLKNEACQNFKKYFNHENIDLVIPYDKLLQELESFEKVQIGENFTYRGKNKSNDDHVMSAVWALYILNPNQIEAFFDVKYEQIGMEVLPSHLKIAYNYADFTDKDSYAKIDKHLDTIFINLSKESSNLVHDSNDMELVKDDFLSNWMEAYLNNNDK